MKYFSFLTLLMCLNAQAQNFSPAAGAGASATLGSSPGASSTLSGSPSAIGSDQFSGGIQSSTLNTAPPATGAMNSNLNSINMAPNTVPNVPGDTSLINNGTPSNNPIQQSQEEYNVYPNSPGSSGTGTGVGTGSGTSGSNYDNSGYSPITNP